jgi:histidinol-phosphate/aromatic aminotransferase/cobyric acid decarboxylase-like protein
MHTIPIEPAALEAAVNEILAKLDPKSIWPAIVGEAKAWLLAQPTVRMQGSRYLFQSGRYPSVLYYTDATSCTCPGFPRRQRCKHIIRARILDHVLATAVIVLASPEQPDAPAMSQAQAQAEMDELFAS